MQCGEGQRVTFNYFMASKVNKLNLISCVYYKDTWNVDESGVNAKAFVEAQPLKAVSFLT